MPGNEVEDGFHNFFVQENLSQGQQVVDGSWHGLSNTPWAGSQRQLNVPFNPNLRNCSAQQSDSELGHGGQSSHSPHARNFMQPTLRPDLSRSHPQSQPPVLGGYGHAQQFFQARQNETDISKLSAESDKHNLMSRGYSMLETQQGNGPDPFKKNMRLEPNESQVSYNFFGGQQQVSGQNPGMMQSISRQKSGIGDMHLIQQQMMYRQMQELQRQQLQRQQQEAREQSSVRHMSGIASQTTGNQSAPLINGVPVHDGSNYSWPSDNMATNNNWLQRGASAVLQGSSTGQMSSPRQTQALRLMGLVPQQVDQSFYGTPVASSKGNLSQFSQVQHISAGDNTFQGNNYTRIPDQASQQDSTLMFRQGYPENNMFGPAGNQASNRETNLENLQQVTRGERLPLQVIRGRQEKEVLPVATSQNVSTLDPTEEKILFGSDDSLWDAFGSSAGMGLGGCNMLDGTDSAFPSIPSGTWSALMQSAVAESSSGGTGPQEEWSGLSLPNAKPQNGNLQSLGAGDSSKPQLVWPDKNVYHTSTLNSVPTPGGAGPNSNYDGVSTNEQRGYVIRPDQAERLQNDSSQRSMHQASEEVNNWLDQRSLRKGADLGSNVPGNVSNSSDADSFLKSSSPLWNQQKSVPLNNSGDQPINTQGRWNSVNPLSSGGLPTSMGQHGNEADGAIKEKIAEGFYGSKMDSAPHSNIGVSQINKGNTNFNGFLSPRNASTMGTTPESNQQLMHNDNFNFWKQIDPSAGSRGNMSKSLQANLETGSHNFILAENNFSNKGSTSRHEVDDSSKKENSSDSLHSNASQHTSTRRENVWLDAGDSQHLPGTKENNFSQVGRRPPGVRKFQYHPMGDVDVAEERLYGGRQTADSQAMHQQVSKGLKSSNECFPSQSSFGKKTMEVCKDYASASQERPQRGEEDPSKSKYPGYPPSTYAEFDRPAVNSSSKDTDTSQKMLELLHKVDQSKGHGTMRNTEIPEAENVDKTVGYPQQKLSSVSQSFGLQLAPPSQRLQIKEQESLSLAKNCQGSTQMPSGALLQASNTAMPYNIHGSNSAVSSSGFPYPRNYLQNQSVTGGSGQVNMNQNPSLCLDRANNQSKQIDASYERGQIRSLESISDMSRGTQENDFTASVEIPPSNCTNQAQARVSSPEFPVLEAAPVSLPSKLPSKSGYNVLQHPVHLHASGLSNSHLKSNNQDRDFSGIKGLNEQPAQGQKQNMSYESAIFNSQGVREEQSMQRKDKQEESTEVHLEHKAVSASQGGTPGVGHVCDASPSNVATTKRDIEAFGRSLRPNNISENYSLLHQVQAMKNSELDSGDRSAKRLKCSDGQLDNLPVSGEGQQLSSYNAIAKDSSANIPSVSSVDHRMGSLLSKPGDNQNANTSTGTYAQSSLQYFPNTDKNAFPRGDCLQISPQMAPSWFDQYGNFRNGKILPAYDVQKSIAAKALGKASENPLACSMSGKMNSAVDAGELGNIQQNLSSEQSSQPLPQVNDRSLVMRSNKRKIVAPELPWFKEVVHGHGKIQTISMAEAEWAQATNRITEKLEDDTDAFEDGPQIVRSKRRLILTTQLMQQLLHPPPASTFSGDSCAHYENLAYFTARLVAGDVCSAISSVKRSSSLSPTDGNIPSEKVKESESQRHGPDEFSKVAEDFVGRAKKLEDNLLRLEKGVSILDLRLECEDLEKFSVINRFAKFHSRAQTDGADASASEVSPNPQKPQPQRYVTAVPAPRNFPDGAQCIPLT